MGGLLPGPRQQTPSPHWQSGADDCAPPPPCPPSRIRRKSERISSIKKSSWTAPTTVGFTERANEFLSVRNRRVRKFASLRKLVGEPPPRLLPRLHHALPMCIHIIAFAPSQHQQHLVTTFAPFVCLKKSLILVLCGSNLVETGETLGTGEGLRDS